MRASERTESVDAVQGGDSTAADDDSDDAAWTASLGDLSDGWSELDELDTKSRRIVDAARDCFAQLGFEDTTMVQIAESAEIGVATVYRRFGTKSVLVRYALMAEAHRVSLVLGAALRRSAGPVSALAEVFAALVDEATAPQLLTRHLRVSSAAGELASFLAGDELIEYGNRLVSRFIRYWQKRGELGAYDPEVVAEILIRLTVTFVSNPNGVLPLSDPDRAREFARRHLAPLLFPLPGGAGGR